MSIYVTGDPHGERGRMVEIDRQLEDEDKIIFCGDWGYLFENNFAENRFLDDLEKLRDE